MFVTNFTDKILFMSLRMGQNLSGVVYSLQLATNDISSMVKLIGSTFPAQQLFSNTVDVGVDEIIG